MGRTERAEYTVGVAALAVGLALLGFAALANRVATDGESGAMTLTAEFSRADGVRVGTPVRLAGVNVGDVRRMVLDDRFRAVATLVMSTPVQLPDDSAAVIETDGVFGDKYIELQPGGSETLLASGGRISYTQDSVIIEDLIAKIIAEAKPTAPPPATEDPTP
ncbi:MAG: MlaD family protein [Rhodospirillaceae bacterium]|nr:MlaD family protein [Rhodospirillaceae bacterium]